MIALFIMNVETPQPPAKVNNVNRSVTEKKRLLSEWEKSTLTMKIFCEQRQISVNGLKAWIKQFDIGRKRKSTKRSPDAFIALVPERLNTIVPFAEYQLPDNSKLTINHPVSASFFKELLSASK
jgi:hypothetical protein